MLCYRCMQIMGNKSYAEFSVHPNMASSPEVVMSFLLEMSEMVRPKADKVLSSPHVLVRLGHDAFVINTLGADFVALTVLK